MRKVKIRKIEYLSTVKLSVIISIMVILFGLFRLYPNIDEAMELFGIATMIRQYLFIALFFCVGAIIFTGIYNAFAKYFGGLTIYIEDEDKI